jgi:hypothetical protein
MDALEGLVAVQAIRDLVRTCLPDGYEGKHMNPQTLVEFSKDVAARWSTPTWSGSRRTSRTPSSPAYHDDAVRQGHRWLLRRREEIPVPFKAGPPPMSDTAMAVSAGTLREPA